MTHIDPKSMICGFPALAVRQVLRRSRAPYTMDAPYLAEQMEISIAQARRLADELVRRGYWERSKSDRGWTATHKGHRLAIANASRQISRSTADRLLSGLVQRLHALTTHPVFVYVVTDAWVFGSYIKGADRLSDVDVLIRVEGREGDKERQHKLWLDRVRAVGRGRRFRNLSEEYTFPYYEMIRFLRGRSRYLEIHDVGEEPALSRLKGRNQIFP